MKMQWMQKAVRVFSLMMVALVLSAGVALAGPRDGGKQKSPEEKAISRSRTLGKKLELNADQQEKVRIILVKSYTDLKDLRANHTKGDGSKEKAKEILRSTDTQINSVLTPAQQEKYAKMKENGKEKAKQHRANKKG